MRGMQTLGARAKDKATMMVESLGMAKVASAVAARVRMLANLAARLGLLETI